MLNSHDSSFFPLGNGHYVGGFKGTNFGEAIELCSYAFSSGGEESDRGSVMHPVDVSVYVAQLFPEDFCRNVDVSRDLNCCHRGQVTRRCSDLILI